MRLKYVLIVVVFLIAVLVSGMGYFSFGQQKSSPAAKSADLASLLESENRVQLLLVGQNKNSSTLYLASYEPISNRFSAIYLPRNSRITSPGTGEEKSLASLIKPLGPAGIRNTLSESLDLKIQYWMSTKPGSLKRIVDLMGGIELDFPFDSRKNGGRFSATKSHWIDGNIAHEYVQTAYRKHGALGRRFRHKTFFLGLINALKTDQEFVQSPQTIHRIKRLIRTNLSKQDLKVIGQILANLDQRDVKFPATAVLRPSNTQNKSLNPRALKNMLPKPLKRMIKESKPQKTVQVQILNGAGISGLAGALRDKLQKKSFVDVVEIGNANRFDYETTQIIARNKNPRSADRIRKLLGTGEIASKPSDNLMVDVTIIAGKDLRSQFEEIN